jgi:hypothetical protein
VLRRRVLRARDERQREKQDETEPASADTSAMHRSTSDERSILM